MALAANLVGLCICRFFYIYPIKYMQLFSYGRLHISLIILIQGGRGYASFLLAEGREKALVAVYSV